MSASIELVNVGLTVPTYQQADRSARSLLASLATAAFDPPKRTQRVLLDGIDLKVASGERLAILGANGSGKSTLLRLIAGAYAPSCGHVHIEGRLQSLLNVALGFNQDATVKENVYLRGAAMGMTIREIHRLAPSVLEFAGLTDRAGDRLRVMSAGQRMRLSFACSTVQQTDIMVMDEWIGTGDADFLEKARARLMGRVEGAKIVLIASHSVPLLMRVCERAIYLDGGRIVGQGALLDVVAEFVPQALPPKPPKPKPAPPPPPPQPPRPPPPTEAELEARREAVRQTRLKELAAAREQGAREALFKVAQEAARAAREAKIAAARAAGAPKPSNPAPGAVGTPATPGLPPAANADSAEPKEDRK
jgi:ABC-type polysaccharide/polyol phosphate transport system ATPase subunit